MPLVLISYFDVFFIAIIVLSTASAFFKGMFREIVSIGVIVLGFALAALYYKAPAGRLAEWFGLPETFAGLAGFLGIFLGCVLAGTLASYLVNRVLKAVKLKWMDRLLGAVFGFLRGWVVSTVLVLALTAFPLKDNLSARSALVPYLLGSAGVLAYFVPKDLKERFDERCREILSGWSREGVDG